MVSADWHAFGGTVTQKWDFRRPDRMYQDLRAQVQLRGAGVGVSRPAVRARVLLRVAVVRRHDYAQRG